ncbi:gag-pre-integrs multi-domain protein [Pyrenophora tritici-repentis]|uniref:Gag-pre-integrs multi-domain protein n=1 Tax=Pyrenophora tritici-repentis TaxID=45151 RepID=A0A922N8R4_9PLEO|nr:gag-pre-integrs multi-domain protein [Pyrenophora tritici-repentis]
MTTFTTRDATVTLRDQSDYTGWMLQLQARCIAHNIWDKIDPKTTTQPLRRPTDLRIPILADYQAASGIEEPGRLSELSNSGQKAFKEDLEYYRMSMEQYKSDRHQYEKEQSSFQHIMTLIQSSVSPHLLRTCCLPDKTLREWIINLKLTVGVSDRTEKERARERYLASLKPMRTPNQWDTWLAEYDQAATEAEVYSVPEVSQLDAMSKDFLVAVQKTAPIWAVNFQENGRWAAGMSRKEMMNRFREHMMMHHPLFRSGKHKAAMAAYDESTHDDTTLAGGASYQPLRGTPSSGVTAPSTNLNPGNTSQTKYRGRPRKQPQTSQAMRKPAQKRSSAQSEGTTSGQKCPACYQYHELRACYYVNPDLAPEWWTPNEATNELVQFKCRKITDVDAAFTTIARSGTAEHTYPLARSFILDSGATCHITNNPDRIYNYRPSSLGDYIWAGSIKIWIRGYGTTDITLQHQHRTTKLVLRDVAICPEIVCNLVSFRLLRQRGIWWDTKSNPTNLRGPDDQVIGNLLENFGQWVLEYNPLAQAFVHTKAITARTQRGPKKASAMLWHKRLGHPGPAAIEHLVQQSEGVRVQGETTVQCDSCGRAKSKRQIRRLPRTNDEGPGERLAIDFHTYEVQAITKEKSQMLITDPKSIIRLLTTFFSFMKNHYNISVKTIESDNEITTVKPDVERWLATQGIRVEPSAPDTQAQNGGAERSGGVNKEKARAMRLDANLSWELWPEITRAAVYLYNRTPNYNNHWKTPYEVFFTRVAFSNGIVTSLRKPNLTHLKAYGCKAFAMTDDTHRGKSRLQRLDPKAWIGYLVGYRSSNIYRIWIPSLAKVISTRDVVFDEQSIFDGKTEDLMDNLMHNTLEEIATHVRTIELPTPAQQPETESFYEDSPPEESLAQDSEGDQPGYYQGRKIRDSYPTPPATPPPAALLARLMAGASLDEKDRQGTPKTAPWAAAFMAGTQAGKVGEYRGVAMDKAAIVRMLAKGLKPHRRGDLNARHELFEPGSTSANRGAEIARWATQNDIPYIGEAGNPTHRAGHVLDVSFSNIPFARTTVREDMYTGSDHFTLVTVLPSRGRAVLEQHHYRVHERNIDRFAGLVQLYTVGVQPISNSAPADVIDASIARITQAIGDAMHAAGTPNREKGHSAPWWTEDCRVAYKRHIQEKSDYGQSPSEATLIRGRAAGNRRIPRSKVQRVAQLLPATPRNVLASPHFSDGSRQDPTQGQGKDIAAQNFTIWWESLGQETITVFSDGSEQQINGTRVVTYGYAIYQGQAAVATGQGSLNALSHVFDAEAIGACRGLKHALQLSLPSQREIVLCIDSTSVIWGIRGTAPTSSQWAFLQIHGAMEAYNVKTRWAPGHMKIVGNELADQLADSEAKDPHQPYGMAASPTRSGIRTVGRRLLEHTRDTWWQDKSSRLSAWYTQWQLPYDTRRTPAALWLPRRILAKVLMIRSTHGDFEWYHRKFNHEDTSKCLCGRPKTPEHLVFCKRATTHFKKWPLRPIVPPRTRQEGLAYLAQTPQQSIGSA